MPARLVQGADIRARGIVDGEAGKAEEVPTGRDARNPQRREAHGALELFAALVMNLALIQIHDIDY